jgi:hypothetical protein
MTEIYHSVSPHLLRRVPGTAFQSVATLLPALKMASQPFRLMDLPPEIRLSIYRYLPLKLCFAVYEHHWTPGSIPALLTSCKQIRKEALPLASLAISLEASLGVFRSGCDSPHLVGTWAMRNLGKQLHRWALCDGHEFVENLSKLHLNFAERCPSCEGPCRTDTEPPTEFELEFNLHPDRGLTVRHCGPWQDDRCLNPGTMEDVHKAVSDLELQRRSYGVYGEIFVMLVSDGLPTWDFLSWEPLQDF